MTGINVIASAGYDIVIAFQTNNPICAFATNNHVTASTTVK